MVGKSPNYFYNFTVILSRLNGQNLCIRILYLIIDNEQYNELLEYLLKGQLSKEENETYEKWAS